MPRYDYRCESCDHIWEVFHMMAEEPELECPECSDSDVVKLISRVSTPYVKGDGWLDVQGRRRDMHLHKLQTDDPYASIRPEGDKEVVETKLRNAGKQGYDGYGNSTGTNFYQNKPKSKSKPKKKKTD